MAIEYKLPYTASEIEDKLGQIDDKLDSSELDSAIDTALTEAKASGEFNGQDGYTPIKGVDYYTPEDEAKIIADVTKNLTQSNIPEYWETHLDEKITNIKALQDETGKDGFSFIVMTDIHYPSNLGKKSPLLAKKIMNECDIKYALVLGDVRNRGCWDTKELAQDEWNKIEEMFKPLKGKELLTQGNHDAGYGTSDGDTFAYEFTPAEMFERVYRKAQKAGNIHYDTSGTAYYIDDISNKVRYILLNTQLNFDGNRGYSSYETRDDGTTKYPTIHRFRYTQCQYDFLINDALATIPTTDWGVIVGSHVPINQTGEMPEYPIMIGVLNAYQNKNTYSGTYTGTADSETAYTNLAEPLPENTTDTTKWVNDYRFSSNGISPQSGTTVSNTIPCTNGNVIRIKGVILREGTDRIQVIGDGFTEAAVAYFNNGYVVGDNTYVTYDGLAEGVYSFTIKQANITGLRFAMPTPIDANGVIITVNEEIVESEHGYDYVSVNCDFSSAKGNLIAYHGGHKHLDEALSMCYIGNSKYESIDFPIITTRCDSAEENVEDLKAERIAGTITEQSFDVFTINKAKQKIYRTKIGAGESQEIGYIKKLLERNEE